MSLDHRPRVSQDGDVVEILAVGYGTSTIAERSPDGGVVAFDETWSSGSVVLPDKRVPLLAHHRREAPIGYLDEFREGPDGLVARGKLVGSANAREHVRALVAGGLTSSASVGFIPDLHADRWTPPARRGQLARVTRHGARISEVSLVQDAAVIGSRVLSILTTDDQQTAMRAQVRAVVEATLGPARAEAAARSAEALRLNREVLDAGARWRHVRDELADADRPPAPPVLTRAANPYDTVDDWSLHVAMTRIEDDIADPRRRNAAPAALVTRLGELRGEIRRRQDTEVWTL